MATIQPKVHSKNSIPFENQIAHGAIVLCALFSVWAITGTYIPPLQDLPDHVARASLLVHKSSPAIGGNFGFVHVPTPYMGSDFLLALLLTFLPVPLAAKVFALGAVAALVAGAAFFLRRTVPGRPELVLACFAILFSKVFAKGNLNFLYGMGVLFTILALWWPRRNSALDRGQVLQLAVLSFVLYLVHLVDLFALVCVLFVTLALKWKRREPLIGQTLLMLCVPAVFMGAYLVLWKGAGASDPPLRLADIFALSNVSTKPENLREMFTLVRPNDALFFAPAALAYLVSLYYSRRSPAFRAGIPVALFLLFWVLISPYHLPGLIRVYERFFLVLVVWGLGLLQWTDKTPRALRTAWIVAMSFTCISTACRFQEFGTEIDPLIQEYYEMLEKIPEGSLVCPVKFANPYMGSLGIFLHIDKYAVAASKAVLPNMIQAKYMLFRYKRELPMAPQRPTVTPEMAATYDYFVVFGRSVELDQRTAQGEFTIVETKPWLQLLRNNSRKSGPGPSPSAGAIQ